MNKRKLHTMNRTVITLKPVTVGMWTLPWIKPRGTKAVQVLLVQGEAAHLSDGTIMHVSHVRACESTTVAP